MVDYVFGQEATEEFLKKLKDFLDFLLPWYQKEGKSQLTIGIGCTGGRHRSVAISEWLASRLRAPERRLTLRHRDIELG